MSHIVSGSEYLALPRQPETWLIKDLLPVGGGGMLLYGDPKIGKSYAALQLAWSLTTQTPWFGFSVPKKAHVVYLQLDTPRSLWADRLDSLRSHGYPIETVHFADRETLGTFPFYINNPDHYKILSDALSAINPAAVIIDTSREAFTSVDENESTAMQEAVARMEACIYPATAVYVSHARKTNVEHGYDLKGDVRGSNYLVGKVDSICRFSHKSMRIVSRTLEEHTVKLDRLEDGTWSIAEDPFKALVDLTISDNPDTPIRELARIIHLRYPEKSEEACRAAVRRARSTIK